MEVWVIGRNYEWRFIHQEGFGQPALMAFVVRSHLGSVGLLGKPLPAFMDEVCSTFPLHFLPNLTDEPRL